MAEENAEDPQTYDPPAQRYEPEQPQGNGRKVYRLKLTVFVAAIVAFAVVGAWLFVFMKIAIGGLADPDVLANSEALIAILAIVGAPAAVIINKVMDKWLGSDD